MKTLRTLLVVVFTFTAFSLSAQLYDKKWTISAGAYFNDFVVTQQFDRLFTDAHWNHKGLPVRISGGFYLAKHWTAVAQFSTVKLDNPYWEDEDQYFDLNLGVQYRFLYEKVFDPYLYATVGGASLKKEFNFAYNGGLGFNIWFTRSFGLYAEAAYGGLAGVDPKEYDATAPDDNGNPINPDGYLEEYNVSDNLNYSFGFRVCPGKEADTDGDGIPDRDDACPDEFGVEEFDGCPDTDGDGIPDHKDACPDVAGVPELNGCPPPPPPPVNKDIIVYFGTDLTKLDDEDMGKLDILADQLLKSEDATIIAAGHTDNTGSENYNQGLSERRARAVKDYLVGKGVAEERITIKGFGENKPSHSNDTEEGRANNRRVEIL